MARLVELSLFIVPFVVFVAWRAMGADRGPSTRLLVVAACLLVVLAGVLVWLSQEEALPPGAAYAPATLQDGQIISGHPAPQ